MAISLGVVMDPIADITFYKDTTLALLLAAQERGWDLHYMEQKDLYLLQGEARASTRNLFVADNSDSWYELGLQEDKKLGDLDVILMRKDPPFDNEYIYSTYILEAAQQQGALVVNDPRSLRDCNEKIFATQFPQCCPPVLVSRDMLRLREFHKHYGDVIFKPLDGMGGSRIFRCRQDDPNVGVILETLTEFGQQLIMAQRYIPAISEGDKRILVVDGEAVPYCLARIPAQGETRGNLAAGGTGVAQPLTEKDRWIVAQVAPVLKAKGLMFVGLDVIGEYLTEINVTSPTCAREIDKAYNTGIGSRLVDAIARKLALR
ncbi:MULTISPECIES: glutathione synthase [unclassified Cellvibrio]|jgi:glutathione synthase|uniref:glutathione synthase n=1 Tax=unclassified Cellvibrio TaxID=2624793 RepID=UPI0002F49A87|nr:MULTISPECIES: glutathione synthase [unclassified Cellvibrio]QEY11422.1 glutathione synthase [Cellvibrio sp. KY-YJ-3]UUA71543.1 glutathione synthase [Cellvibrio sp. QJXJ]